MNIQPAAVVTATLERAAGQLLGAGRADPFSTDPSVRLLCLAAADQLRTLEISPERLDVAAHQVQGVIRAALTGLSTLPPEVFSEPAVLDAAAQARDALALLD